MTVERVTTRTPGVARLIAQLSDELAGSGYPDEEMFGYSLEQLDAGGVVLVGAYRDDELAGIGGIEVDDSDSTAELKRFFVAPGHRGTGLADEIMAELLTLARAGGVTRVRLETGNRQVAAIRFYRRHGFAEIDRFGPYVDSASSVCMERMLSA